MPIEPLDAFTTRLCQLVKSCEQDNQGLASQQVSFMGVGLQNVLMTQNVTPTKNEITIAAKCCT